MKIKYIPCQPHCFAFGGFDLQMLHTLDALNKIGVVTTKLNLWDRDNDFDIIHFWGLDVSQFRAINFAKKSKKKIVITALTGYHENTFNFFKFKLVSKLQWPNYNSDIIRLADAFVVLNEGQAEYAVKYLGVPYKKISIIPAILNDKFFEFKPICNSFEKQFGLTEYILTTGNVGSRKNQLALALACDRIKKQLVIIGNEASGEESYASQLNDLISKSQYVKWIKELDNNSDILLAAYSEATIFALVSKDEQQPMSAIEAAKMGKPLLLADRMYAKQPYFKNACLTNFSSINDIAHSILKILESPERYITDDSDYSMFGSKSVAEQYSQLYFKIMNSSINSKN